MGEATNTSFICFGLSRPGLEHEIYNFRSKHANHYTTGVISPYCIHSYRRIQQHNVIQLLSLQYRTRVQTIIMKKQ